MTTAAQDRVARIVDEVEDLHPLLEALFQDHPNITGVEYTHGQHEMGADFVLTRTHEVLGTQQWIGVVAKIGKIHQDLGTIERQIDECNVPRLVEGGKKKISVSEVWVVATSTITHGAQTRLHEKFQSSNLQFIDGRGLAAMIDEHIPHYISELPLPVSTYLADTHARIEETDKRVQLVQLGGDALMIDQDIKRVEYEPYVQNKEARPPRLTKVDLLKEASSQKTLLLEAGMGGGKSKHMRRLALHYTTPSIFLECHILPVLTSLTDILDTHNGDLDALISAHVPAPVREDISIHEGHYMILVDAVDEKELEQDALIEAFESLLDQVTARDDLRLVCACRFMNSAEFDRRFLNRLARYQLCSLSLGRIIEFLKVVCEKLNLEGRIVDDLQRSPLFARLPHSPIAALLLGQLLNQTREELPATMTELYSKFMELALGRWDIQKGLMSQQEYEVSQTVLGDIAHYMIENGLDVVAIGEFQQRIDEYLRDRNLTVSVDDILHHAIERCEVLVSYPETGTIAFKHRSFAEFLCAQHMTTSGLLGAEEKAWDLYWTNVYFFSLGLTKDAPDMLRALIGTDSTVPGRRLYKPIALGDYMLAAYATPYRVIEEGVIAAAKESASLFMDIRRAEEASPFTGLSAMHLLYFLQLIFRDKFGFAFYRKALETAALTIATAADSPEEDAHAVFFLAVAAIEAGNGDGFDFLLKDYRDHLPIDVSLAVLHEADAKKSRSKLIKKLRRKVRDNLKGNASLKAYVNKLYDRTLAQPPQGN